MYRANQQNNGFLRTATNLGLLGALAATLTGACVSSNNGNNATGGTTSMGGTSASTGGVTSTGGAIGSGGATAAACNLSTGVVDGCQVAPNPQVFAITDTCSIGLWAGDPASGGGFYAPWCTGTGGSATCTLALACSAASNSMHVSGTYSGSGSGNAGFGTYLQVYSDGGVGCPKMDITGFTGVTIDINATTVPNNNIYFGLSLGDGNAAEKTITTVTGAQSLKIPFGTLTRKNACGTVTGTGVAGIYLAFAWFSDNASHPIDVTFSNIGFY